MGVVRIAVLCANVTLNAWLELTLVTGMATQIFMT